MTITLSDKTKVSMRHTSDYKVMLTFHGIDKRFTLPVGTVPTIGLLQSLYNALKG